ncbi:MAG: hypothetical protein K2X29_05800 [Candidatus Obscuribacterales bacterium]|nr:hypothetical protein [Candidatus Obscuribacterales bacterium]
MLEDRVAAIEQQLQSIHERNQCVEADKAWEVSLFRRVTISVLTYVITGLMFAAIGDEKCWIDALIPVVGYALSAESLPITPRWWLQKRYSGK